jgi:cyclophilin family peptidyl-prolyl cis-trans isomerase
MSLRTDRSRWLRGLAAGLLAGSVALSGCGKKAEPKEDSAPSANVPAASKEVTKADPVAPAGPIVRDTQHQAFADAVRNSENPPADADRPPDETVSKKPVYRILENVRESWDTIRFTSAAGKKITYTAVVDTSAGPMQIALFADLAPNHVRNFIALAKAGYYDQLFIERSLHEENPATNQEVHMLEAGCPLGTGQTKSGSIGYWLKQEFTPGDKMTHEEGTVGACRAEEEDTAATRFYINLTKAPFLDGNYTVFGKVVEGLDVLRKIAKEPVVIDDEGVSRPEKAILINKVTILAQEVEPEKK